MEFSLLSLILFFPCFTAVFLLFVPSNLVKILGLSASCFNFLLSLILWIRFDNSTAHFQFFESFSWLPSANIEFGIGVDGITIYFVVLTTFLVPACLLVGWTSIQHSVREYYVAFLILESLMLAVFVTLDLLLFYVFFESVLIPMFFIIGIWGSRERKIRAAFQFFLYTLLGSVLMLLAILLIYFQAGTTDYQILLTTNFSEKRQLLLWLAFFSSFAVKVPMIPVHIWLPEAHVEAPTAGSVILAGILLKLGTYGFLRFSIPMFPHATLFFTPLIYTMSVIAIIYASLTTLRQVDLKKIIAYSSVAHMNYVTLGIFSLNLQGIEGSILLMLSHGLVSSALFLCVGCLYERTHTRLIRYYGGCVQTMPIFSMLFLFFTLGNISLPGTSSFVGEFLILSGVFQTNPFAGCLAASGMIFGTAYSMWLYNRLAFTNAKYHLFTAYSDLNRREIALFLPFVFGVLWMGLFPEVFLEGMHVSVSHLIQHGNF
uniref:NADH-ubiquinone oxidoreductase chain 4 n=1 Tax=Pyramimonas parkeae TaxID=36894 RepID=A0A1D8I1R7_9CHLO|nr:NADH dehydrogenase subunit 4 [Pyramimonas parkeae]AOT98929.1 NADH dehydrogenase subunit 4 [Pyramimonas parkeae]